MGIAEGMKNIVENIVDSHDIRTKEVNSIVMDTKGILKDARTILQDFSRERKVKASEQAEKLADFTTDLTKNVDNMIKGFRKNRKEMSEKQKKDMDIFIGKLEDDVEKLKDGVSLMMDDFKKNRKEMAEELRDKLAKEVKDIKTNVKSILDDADELISGYRSDMKEAKAAWQGMSSVSAKSKKGVIIPKIEAKEKVTIVEKNIEKKPVENSLFDNKIEKKAVKKKKK